MADRWTQAAAWVVSGAGWLIAVLSVGALAVESSPAAAAVVQALGVVAGATTGVGGALVATGRLSSQPSGAMAALPGALAGGALALSTDAAPTWVYAAAGVGVACGTAGFVLVAVATERGDSS